MDEDPGSEDEFPWTEGGEFDGRSLLTDDFIDIFGESVMFLDKNEIFNTSNSRGAKLHPFVIL